MPDLHRPAQALPRTEHHERAIGLNVAVIVAEPVLAQSDQLGAWKRDRSVVQHVGGARSADPRAVDGPLARVRRALDEQLTRRVPLGEMAALAGLSRFHFLRAFSRAYGVSPYAYSLNRRLLEAQRRLSHGAAISMTALEFGFADQAHLTRHFLRTIGVTPGEYQRAFVA